VGAWREAQVPPALLMETPITVLEVLLAPTGKIPKDVAFDVINDKRRAKGLVELEEIP